MSGVMVDCLMTDEDTVEALRRTIRIVGCFAGGSEQDGVRIADRSDARLDFTTASVEPVLGYGLTRWHRLVGSGARVGCSRRARTRGRSERSIDE